MNLIRLLLPSTSVFALLAATAAPVAAVESPEACGEAGCPRGYACELVPLPCPGIACVEGQECEPCEPVAEPECVPLPCSSDADCDSAMRCIESEYEECTGGAAPCADPGGGGEPACPEPTPSECTPVHVSQCLPRWALACETAADCGTGFTCEERQSCGCSGSSGPAGGGAESADPDAGAPACECEPTGEFGCVAVEVDCTSNADCEDGWTCGDNPESVCSSTPEGGDCSAAPEYVCLPPFWNLGVTRGRTEDGEPSSPGFGQPASDGSQDNAGSESNDDSSGCTVAAGRSRAGGSRYTGLGLAMLALVAVSRRRRAPPPERFAKRTAR